jgi:glycosyltransferase involved in cell wall biosynthesis
LRLLWLSWKDIKNPASGGAEVFTHEVARRLIGKGHEVDLFTSRFRHSLPSEDIDGVNITRDGGKYMVYTRAREYYKKFKGRFDVVIDEINTRPFLTPLFVKEKPILAMFHQLAREFWFYETFFPISYLGYYYLEEQWLFRYKNIPTVTISNSSRNDLAAMGFKKIFVVPQGLSAIPLRTTVEKDSRPTLVFLGRLKKAKLPHHAIQAYSLIKECMPDAKLWIIGSGYMLNDLQKYKVDDIEFYGHVTNQQKCDLLSKAHLILVPAVREGWSLAVTEANAMGTPALGYNVQGLRDSIVDGETGILVRENSPYGLAQSTISLLKDPLRLCKMSSNALAFSKRFSWDNTSEEFEKVLKTIM